MYPIHNNAVIVDKTTTRLEGFRLEDTDRAPVIILFIDNEQPRLLPLKQGRPLPTIIKSDNMETEIQIITYDEIHTFMHQGHEH